MTREEYRDLEPTQRALSHLDEAQALVEEAIMLLGESRKLLIENNGPEWLYRQIEAFTLPWLERCFDGSEPGSIGEMLRRLEGEGHMRA
jgi:hypothetical protein